MYIMFSGPWKLFEQSVAFRRCNSWMFSVHPAAVRCDMVLHQVFSARRVRKSGSGGELRHGVASGVSCETSKTRNATPHLHRE